MQQALIEKAAKNCGKQVVEMMCVCVFVCVENLPDEHAKKFNLWPTERPVLDPLQVALVVPVPVTGPALTLTKTTAVDGQRGQSTRISLSRLPVCVWQYAPVCVCVYVCLCLHLVTVSALTACLIKSRGTCEGVASASAAGVRTEGGAGVLADWKTEELPH